MADKVVHFEIPADDLDRARAFYREAFGWTINSIPELDYSTSRRRPPTTRTCRPSRARSTAA